MYISFLLVHLYYEKKETTDHLIDRVHIKQTGKRFDCRYIYIYRYREREREGERQTETERETETEIEKFVTVSRHALIKDACTITPVQLIYLLVSAKFT